MTYIDWLILASSRLHLQHLQAVLRLSLHLGFVPNRKKSDLIPSQRFSFLGMDFNTTDMAVRPTLARLLQLSESLSALSQCSQVSVHVLASLLGIMESVAGLLPLGRVHKRKFQREFQARWAQSLQSWEHPVLLGQWFLESTL